MNQGVRNKTSASGFLDEARFQADGDVIHFAGDFVIAVYRNFTICPLSSLLSLISV
jgi:hypothetical protein